MPAEAAMVWTTAAGGVAEDKLMPAVNEIRLTV